jgi:NADH:ubiquinone oxidoreductase subunit 3 (subunit A)
MEIILSPPLAFLIFLAIGYAIYRLGGAIAAPGKPHPGKRATYACGEDIPAQRVAPSYRDFFYLALLFAILHLAALVVATAPGGAWPALLYLAGIGVSVYALMGVSERVSG